VTVAEPPGARTLLFSCQYWDRPPEVSVAQAQPPASVHLRSSLSAQPLRSVKPEEPTSKPELLEVEPVVPEVVMLMANEPLETARPLPVKSVKASLLMVRVRPVVRVRLEATVVEIADEPMLMLVAEAVPRFKAAEESSEVPSKVRESRVKVPESVNSAKGVPASEMTKSPVEVKSRMKLPERLLVMVVGASKDKESENSVKLRISSAIATLASFVGDAVTEKSVLKSRVSTLTPTATSLFSTLMMALEAPESEAHSQTSVVSFHLRIWASEQPWSKVRPAERASRPEPDEVVDERASVAEGRLIVRAEEETIRPLPVISVIESEPRIRAASISKSPSTYKSSSPVAEPGVPVSPIRV